MLSEPECRVLSSVFDTLLLDFDPKDAVIFLESAGLLTEDLAEKIESKATRLERLRELLRIYRRRATDCELLISYFEYAGQEHIANAMRHDLEHVLDGYGAPDVVPRFPHHLRLRKLLAGGVPRVFQHVKREGLQMQVAKTLRERADLDSFFVVLHGIAGCGKSSLAAALFAEVPDLLGNCFESVVWLRDSTTEPSRTRYLFADLLLMLWDDATSDPPRVDDMSSVYLYKQIEEALIDRPNVIVVLDDVVQKETIKFANQLGLRVLATTRNAELFASATCSVDVIHVGGVTLEEAEELLDLDDDTPSVGSTLKAHTAISDALSICSGNVALLNILKKLSAGRAERLTTFCRRVKTRGLSAVTATTAFEYESMHAALSISVERLPACDRDTLACAVVLPSEQEIPLEVRLI
ncbi:NB-ARC domain protein [Oesophagostomum dentatum]|uniref:NB-ARC domain protein n=2 Tax=Oesophagostomum dentatum TaxID=61180 RepID=A0A0B1SN82_OESDE|nr:NB-ARC domain protein [Oesophagostomum dentatum]